MIIAPKLGHQFDPPQTSYYSFEAQLAPRLETVNDSSEVDLREFTSPRHNQVDTGTCVAQSCVKALELKRIQKYGREAHYDLSVLQVYFLAREMMFPKATTKDEGTHISLGCDVIRRFGVCREEEHPFSKENLHKSPSWSAMRSAYLNRFSKFYRINSTGDQRVAEVEFALRANHPVIFATYVGTDWFGYRGGSVLKRESNEVGSHATVILGRNRQGDFIGENSWGNSWGEDGFYRIDPEVISYHKSGDFWVATTPFEDIQ